MIYLDNAATSYPKPEGLVLLLEDYLSHRAGNPGRSGHMLSVAASEAVFETRCAVSNLIGCPSPENIVFTQNATHALNTIIRARINPGDHVLISDLEHNSVYRPIWRLADKGLITYSVFSHHGNVCENIRHQIKHSTKMLICTHISNVCGFEMPIQEITRLCRDCGVFSIIDASQSIGHQKVDINDLNCDALCAPGHKGLLGLQGSGFLYIREKDGLRDVFQGGSGTDSLSPQMPSYLPDRYEAGTLPTPAILSIKHGIDYINTRGIQNIHAHEQKLSSLMHRHIEQIKNAVLYSAPTSGIIAFRIKNRTSEEIASELDKRGICVRGGLHCAPLAHYSLGTQDTGLVRLSVGAFNSPGEIEVSAYHIKQIAKKAGIE